MNFDTGASTGTAYIGSQNKESIRLGGGDYWRYEAVVRIPTLSTSGQRFTTFAGFNDQSGIADATDGCYFRYSDNINSAEWQGVCANNSTQSVCDTNIAVAAATYYRLTVAVNSAGNSTDFQVNGVSTCQVTGNIPTTRTTGFAAGIIKSVGAPAASLWIDYMEVEGQFGSPR
jgi:hypothetical protein